MIVTKSMNPKPSVFVIYGRNRAYLNRLLELLRRLGIDAHTFDSIPKRGSPTVIELLEEWICKVDAVIVLMTPDDEGRLKGIRFLKPRARQNVVFEAGYSLISARDKNLVVKLGDVEHLSDMEGIHIVKDLRWSSALEWNIAKRMHDLFPCVPLTPVLHFMNYAYPIKKHGGKQCYRWRIFLDKPTNAVQEIREVRYQLHHTFRNPIKVRRSAKNRFKLTITGWGEFTIKILIKYRDGEEGKTKYKLDLTKPWPGH